MYAVAADYSNSDIAAVWRTKDGGQNWAMVNLPPNAGPPDPATGHQGGYNQAIAVSPASCSTFVIGWEYAAFASFDGGNSYPMPLNGVGPQVTTDIVTWNNGGPSQQSIWSGSGFTNPSIIPVADNNNRRDPAGITGGPNWNVRHAEEVGSAAVDGLALRGRGRRPRRPRPATEFTPPKKRVPRAMALLRGRWLGMWTLSVTPNVALLEQIDNRGKSDITSLNAPG